MGTLFLIESDRQKTNVKIYRYTIVHTSAAASLRRAIGLFLFCCASLFVGQANALIEIEITEGVESTIPIAIVPFSWEGGGSPPVDVAQIVSDDLHRSGYFDPFNRDDLVARPVGGAVPNYRNWQISGAEFLLIGAMRPTAAGYEVDFQLFDVVQQRILSAFTFKVTDQTLRSASHQIADEVFEEILGLPGAFNTQIAFVSVQGSGRDRTFRLQLADADGENEQSMLTSPRPIISPAWGPDGVRIAYVSFEDRTRSAIYVQDRQRGSRQKVLSQEGINGAPSWSPDGTRLAVVLSYEGNPEIYILDLVSGERRRLTQNSAIDTEPAWLDNNTLVFTSDRSGGPQIYKVASRGGRAERLTFEGDYNASVSVSPDSSTLAFVHNSGAGYQIATLDIQSGLFQTVTNGSLDESPSFAPNGQMIMFATEQGGRGVLGAVSIDGSVVQSLSLDSGSVREPAWSPYSR